MKWRVEIDEIGDQRLLRDVVESLSLTITEVNGKSYLAGDPFETFLTAADVRAHVVHIQSILADLSRSDGQINLGFGTGTVEEQLDGGLWRRNHSVELASTAHAVSVVGGTVTPRIDGPSEAEQRALKDQQREREYQQQRRKAIAWTVSASRNPNARQVQRILNAELTPLTIGHIVEFIQADPGALKEVGISRNQLGRLTGSINHPDIYGEDARHSVREHEPPPKPMGLDEARVFIRELANRWFERIAGI